MSEKSRTEAFRETRGRKISPAEWIELSIRHSLTRISSIMNMGVGEAGLWKKGATVLRIK